jgi:hypothetical protein
MSGCLKAWVPRRKSGLRDMLAGYKEAKWYSFSLQSGIIILVIILFLYRKSSLQCYKIFLLYMCNIVNWKWNYRGYSICEGYCHHVLIVVIILYNLYHDTIVVIIPLLSRFQCCHDPLVNIIESLSLSACHNPIIVYISRSRSRYCYHPIVVAIPLFTLSSRSRYRLSQSHYCSYSTFTFPLLSQSHSCDDTIVIIIPLLSRFQCCRDLLVNMIQSSLSTCHNPNIVSTPYSRSCYSH